MDALLTAAPAYRTYATNKTKNMVQPPTLSVWCIHALNAFDALLLYGESILIEHRARKIPASDGKFQFQNGLTNAYSGV